MNKNINLIATTTFGLEAIVKRELLNLGYDNLVVTDGRVNFPGTLKDIPKTNIWLRSAERVLLKIGEFDAYTFDELFEGTKALPWADFIPKDANFIVNGKSVKSTLFSISDCQSIVEKAVVEKLKLTYNVDWFEKSGATYKILVSLLRDKVTVTIDTSGPGLHKRGYRQNSVTAPLKETLACALIDLSYWKKDRILLDPVCGSGTILIEASMIARNIAPGLSRSFVSQDWELIPEEYWKEARSYALSQIDNDVKVNMIGSDIDPENIEIAIDNAYKAGVDDCITFYNKPFSEVTLDTDYGVIICNPPYGERIGSLLDVENLYREMGALLKTNSTWSFYAITSHEEFEKLYGKRASKKRKLFNGMIKTDYYQYFGDRPPKNYFD